MSLKSQLDKINLGQLKCFYADVRLEEEVGTFLGFKNGQLESFTPTESLGAFLRVYNNGKWFYKSLTSLDQIDAGFEALIQESSRFKGQCIDLFKNVPTTHEEILRFSDRDPRHIPLKDKRAICESYLSVSKEFKEINETCVNYRDRMQTRAFKSSRGRSFVYDYAEYGLSIPYALREGTHFFRDYYRVWSPSIEGLKNHHSKVKDFIVESLRHLKAPTITPGKYPVVMNPEVVGVFTHESFGHKSEADFMLGDEAAIGEWKIGMQVASDCLSIVDVGDDPGNSGYCPFDDEGMPTRKTYLIKNGKLQGRLHSLETAHALGEAPTGNARAINFEFEPIVRMTNTYIEPGTQSPEELIKNIREGVYVCNYRHGSGLSTFTIAPTRAYWIRDGKIAEPVRVAVISGTVFDTLKKISGISSALEIHSSAFGGCGKDEQSPLRVADGGPAMIVDEMQVG